MSADITLSHAVQLAQAYLSLLEEHASVKEQLSLCRGELKQKTQHWLDACTEIIVQAKDKEAAQKDNAVLRNGLKGIAANTCCDKCQEAALVAQQLLYQTPTDIICITREELMEPSEGMISVAEELIPWSRGTESRAGVPYPEDVYRTMITEFLKEREDK